MGIHKVTEEANGDHLISSFERRLWDLAYYCLLKFECPVMFNVFGPNAPLRVDQNITFFVPYDHPKCEDIRKFILDELADEVRPGKEVDFDIPVVHTEYWYGCSVTIAEYSGPNFYLENCYSKPMIKEMAAKFMKYLDEKVKEKVVH
jgi:hypothetical protein